MEHLISELEYTPGKAKNNTLFAKEGVRVVVISISAGDELAAHRAPVDVMIIGLEGQAEVTLLGEKHHMIPHANIRFPAGVVHSVKALTNFKMLLIK